MNRQNDTEAQQRRRSGSIIAGALMLMLVTMQAFASRAPIEIGSLRLIDVVRTSGFAVLAAVLALRATTALTLRRQNPALNDELTRANRANAAFWGYWALMFCGLATLALSLVFPLTALDIVPYFLMIGAFVPALRFARAERRDLKDA